MEDFLRGTFVPKKRLGQNFLVDKRVVARIVEACELSADETILEIGPGTGALTREMMPLVRRIIAVETDRQLAEKLRTDFPADKLEVHCEDFLRFDLAQVPRPLKAVGNLPYYISSPIIGRVLKEREVFSALFMTAQLEFGERLVALPGSKDYGALSVLVQFYADTKLLFRIGNQAFRPVPKVNSCFIRMTLRNQPAISVKDVQFFEKVVRLGFLQRRKTLLNALASLGRKDMLASVLSSSGLPTQVRAENLSVQDFGRLADLLLEAQP
ncbi:MAG: ribosomal RNA small subunit methyltransferase A [Candidatus Omnitrophica bacterium]|nr:ribosomal RNA small subunit methyltransferase A [Candidatus Omnitrophota bacterium]